MLEFFSIAHLIDVQEFTSSFDWLLTKYSGILRIVLFIVFRNVNKTKYLDAYLKILILSLTPMLPSVTQNTYNI